MDWALSYLARYASSRAQLERYLRQRASRSLRRAGLAADPGLAGAIEHVAERCVELGLVDERALARSRLTRLLARGASRPQVEADLRRRGIPPEIVREELAAFEGEAGREAEEQAAQRLLERRGLLPGPAGWSEDRRRKALTVLARAGFTLRVAEAVIGKTREPQP